jgi:hypothetical protein
LKLWNYFRLWMLKKWLKIAVCSTSPLNIVRNDQVTKRSAPFQIFADLTMYWFPVCHFRCKEFKPLVIWKILLFLLTLFWCTEWVWNWQIIFRFASIHSRACFNRWKEHLYIRLLTWITGSSSRLLRIRFSADLTMYWFSVCYFRYMKFKPLVIWTWNQNIAISTIVG